MRIELLKLHPYRPRKRGAASATGVGEAAIKSLAAVREVRAFLRENNTIKRVVFNVFKDEDRAIYERLLI